MNCNDPKTIVNTLTNISSKKPIVLVVDDEPFIQVALSSLLSKLGCVVEKASNGKIAVEMVNKKISKENKYDLILMDANMPVMNGYEAAKEIVNMNLNIPIVCVSAQDSKRHRELCKEVGVNEETRRARV